ncbi:MAG: hypothetical protein C4304_00940 [candidate division GAL15 bacterium]
MAQVVVDRREARSGVPERLRALGVEVVKAPLPVGDYVPSPRLRRAFLRPLYVIDGKRVYGLRQVHPNCARAGLAILPVTYGIPTVFTEDAEDTAAFLLLVARREQWGQEVREEELAQVPGIGRVLARRIREAMAGAPGREE